MKESGAPVPGCNFRARIEHPAKALQFKVLQPCDFLPLKRRAGKVCWPACRQSTKIREIDFLFSMTYELEFWPFWEPEEAKR
jgi:hypothetical protein